MLYRFIVPPLLHTGALKNPEIKTLFWRSCSKSSRALEVSKEPYNISWLLEYLLFLEWKFSETLIVDQSSYSGKSDASDSCSFSLFLWRYNWAVRDVIDTVLISCYDATA